MGTTEPSIVQEQPNQDLSQISNQPTHKRTILKAGLATFFIFALLIGTLYFVQQTTTHKSSKPDQGVLQSTPIPPIEIVKKSLYVETADGQKDISTRVYNKNMYTKGVHDVPTATIVELDNGFVLTEYTPSTQEEPNGTAHLWYYNNNTKELARPNLPEKYSTGFDYATATKYDNKSVVISVAKYIPTSNSTDPQTDETYLWNTETNTTKNLVNLANACGTSILEGDNKFVCDRLKELVPVNENEAIAVFSFGDACYGENLIYKYNLNTDTVSVIDAFNNNAGIYKELMGFYKGDMLIAEQEKLPQRTENEFCPNTKTTKLYTMDISKKITKNYDLSKLITTENPFTDLMLGSEVSEITFSSDRFTAERPTLHFMNLETEQIRTSQKYPETLWESPKGTFTKEVPAPEEFGKITHIQEQTVEGVQVLAGLAQNGGLVQLFNSSVLDSAKPEPVRNAEKRLRECGDIKYTRNISDDKQAENQDLFFVVKYELLHDVRYTDSTMPDKVALTTCVQTIPDYTATYRLNLLDNALELVSLQDNPLIQTDMPESIEDINIPVNP